MCADNGVVAEGVTQTGQEVTAKVVDFNKDARKISLSIKAMLNDQEKEESSEE